MIELKELLMCILIVLYGLGAYILGRINFIDNIIVRKLKDFVNDINESEDTK